VCRVGAGGIFRVLRTGRMVDALTRVTELEQFALDPHVPPAVVLSGKPLDQRGDLSADRRPSDFWHAAGLMGPGSSLLLQDDNERLTAHERLTAQMISSADFTRPLPGTG
jgi:hypothetical protein